jgi:transcriptional antiterminator NusG
MMTDEQPTTTTAEPAAEPPRPEAAAPEAPAVDGAAPAPEPAAVVEHAEPIDAGAPAAEAPPEPAPAEGVAAGPAAEDAAPEESPAAPEAAPAELATNKHWYVVKVQSGREDSIKRDIERKVKIEGLEEYFGQIFIPTEKVTEMRNSKRVTRERKVLPGYIMAEVEYNDRILYLFRETSGVGDFVGGTLNRPPPPMTQREIDKWLGKKPGDEPADAPIKHDFEKNDRVKVKDGMFKDMEGEVKEIIEAKNQVKVELTIFGRPVTVEFEYWQVEHV